MSKSVFMVITAAAVSAINIVLIGVSPASAAVFTSRVDFENAVNPDASENFNSIVTDMSFQNTSVIVGDFAITGVPGWDGNGEDVNKIDAPDLVFDGLFGIDGTTYLIGDILFRDNTEIRIDFLVGISAWGADFVGFANQTTTSRNTTISFFDAADNLIGTISEQTTEPDARVFYGIDLGSAVAAYLIIGDSSLSSSDAFNDVFGIDNITYRTSDVPIPGAALLFGSVIAVGTARRKWSKV